MEKSKEDLMFHENYLKEFSLWRQAEEIRINELKRVIEDSDKIKSLNEQMLELSEQRLNTSLKQHEEYLKEWEEQQND